MRPITYENDLERELKGKGTVKQRIIAHLSDYSLIVYFAFPYTTLPMEVCQNGIAESVGISRAHASLELVELAKQNVVGVKLAHVEGSHKRRKVYYLKEV